MAIVKTTLTLSSFVAVIFCIGAASSSARADEFSFFNNALFLANGDVYAPQIPTASTPFRPQPHQCEVRCGAMPTKNPGEGDAAFSKRRQEWADKCRKEKERVCRGDEKCKQVYDPDNGNKVENCFQYRTPFDPTDPSHNPPRTRPDPAVPETKPKPKRPGRKNEQAGIIETLAPTYAASR